MVLQYFGILLKQYGYIFYNKRTIAGLFNKKLNRNLSFPKATMRFAVAHQTVVRFALIHLTMWSACDLTLNTELIISNNCWILT